MFEPTGTSSYQVLDERAEVAVTVADGRVSFTFGSGAGSNGHRLTVPLPVAELMSLHLSMLLARRVDA